MAIVKSSGLAIVYKGKLLLGHPTGHKEGCLSIPKGRINKGETKIEAAIRETFEEVGVKVPLDLIGEEGDKIVYKKSKNGVRNAGKTHKIVYWFKVEIQDLSQIGLSFEKIEKSKLQLREIDWAAFIPSEEIESKIFWRFIPIAKELNLI